MNQKPFNIYYLNFNKVYEIAMMINNIIPEKLEKEKSIKKELHKKKNYSTEASLGSEEYLAKIKAVSGNEKGSSYTTSNRMIETLNVKTTKSILLRELERKCKEYNEKTIFEGDLVKIDNVKLNIYEQNNLREIQLLRKDALKGFSVQGLDVNNLISSMLSDYCYVLTGNIDNSEKEIILKIPMELDNEFENKYSIYDLLIGKVSLIGVYKGDVSGREIYDSTFQYFTAIGENQQKQNAGKVLKSNNEFKIEKNNNKMCSSQNNNYNFIDIIGIIQNIEFNPEEKKKDKWYKRWFKKVFKRKEQKLLDE